MSGTPFEAHALYGVSLSIADGEFVRRHRPYGSGKSTLISHLNALERSEPGAVFVNGMDFGDKETDLRAVRRAVGLVFQYPEYQLFEETVERDVAFGPRNLGLGAGGDPRARRAGAQAGRAGAGVRPALAVRAVRRPEAARRDRGRAGDAAFHAHPRRARGRAGPRRAAGDARSGRAHPRFGRDGRHGLALDGRRRPAVRPAVRARPRPRRVLRHAGGGVPPRRRGCAPSGWTCRSARGWPTRCARAASTFPEGLYSLEDVRDAVLRAPGRRSPMLKNVTFGQFFPGQSFLHRMDPRMKADSDVRADRHRVRLAGLYRLRGDPRVRGLYGAQLEDFAALPASGHPPRFCSCCCLRSS